MPLRRVERRHQERVLGRNPVGHRLAHHPVDVAVVGDVVRVAVVGAERDPARPELLDERKQGTQVAGHRRLADEQPHAGAQPLAALLDGQRLVVGGDPRRDVGLQVPAQHAGRMAVDVLRAVERELLELAGVAGDHARVVHHLGQPEHPPATHERLQVAARERAAGRLER